MIILSSWGHTQWPITMCTRTKIQSGIILMCSKDGFFQKFEVFDQGVCEVINMSS